MNNRKCGNCGNKGHNARTCTSINFKAFTKEMVEIINGSMKSISLTQVYPTLAIDKEGQLILKEAPHIYGLLALSFCRVYLSLPQKDCSGPPPGTLGSGGVVIVPE